MQFALPPRKTSNPPPYSRPSRSTIQRRNELRTTAVLGCAIISILFLVYYMSASNVPTAVSDVSGISDKSKVVIITVLDDDTYGSEYTQRVKENREDYAKRHGKPNFPYLPILLLLANFCMSQNEKDTPTSSPMSRAMSHTSRTTPNRGPSSPPCATR